MWCCVGATVKTTGVAGIGGLSIEVSVCSAENLFISLFLVCCSRVIMILDEAVLSSCLEESLKLYDDGGGLWLTDFGLQSAGLLLVE